MRYKRWVGGALAVLSLVVLWKWLDPQQGPDGQALIGQGKSAPFAETPGRVPSAALDGCNSGRSSPFQSGPPSTCDRNQTTLAPEKHADDAEPSQAQISVKLTRLKEGLARGEPDSAASLLSFGQTCGASEIDSSPQQRQICEFSLPLKIAALTVLERSAANGHPDAQFYLSNWLNIENDRAFDLAAAKDPSTVGEKSARADQLFRQAVAAGSPQARKMLEAQEQMLAAMPKDEPSQAAPVSLVEGVDSQVRQRAR